MKIDRPVLQKIAHLARLEFDQKSEHQMIESLGEILDWMDKLNEVDTEGVEPLTNMSHEVNVFREDQSETPLDHDRGLMNAPQKDADYFRVPKVLE